jgi:glycosyltransferase involved in cell wall biosynthesis
LGGIVAFPASGIFGLQAAMEFERLGCLDKFFTSFCYLPEIDFEHRIKSLFGSAGSDFIVQLNRRAISGLPHSKIHTRPHWEIIRTLADRANVSPILIDRVWDQMIRDFTKNVASQITKTHKFVYAYEYSALEIFEAASKVGAARILDLPSLEGRQFKKIQDAEKLSFPGLSSQHDTYFESKFGTRQERRDKEVELADIIITNSSLTRQSYIDAGANPDKIFAVPLGAPVPDPEFIDRMPTGPLKVMWAGVFSIRKGAHYFLDAISGLATSSSLKIDVYGALALPDLKVSYEPQLITFHGSVDKKTLFDAYAEADVLLFPTLSDGFGMVVTEALSRGLPVITTRRAGASDLIVEGENGLIIEAGDSPEIVRALTWCLANRQRLSQMRMAAIATALNWQWSDYREGVVSALTTGLERAGFDPIEVLKAS